MVQNITNVRRQLGNGNHDSVAELRAEMIRYRKSHLLKLQEFAIRALELLINEPSEKLDIDHDSLPLLILATRSAGVSVREMGRELHVAPSSVVRWEERKQHPNPLIRRSAGDRLLSLIQREIDQLP